MDFTQFDNRDRAERGAWLHLVHPVTGEPLYDDDDKDKPCRVLVRGAASPTIQKVMRRKMLEDFERERKLSKDKIEEQRRVQVMEDTHRRLVEGAAPFVMEFENVQRDGRPATAPDDVEWFLNLVFPVMRAVETGGEMRFELANKPFGHQIATFAADAEAWLGND